MSNYTKSTDFTAKDSLPSGDSQKVIRGSEFDTEFSAIATAVNSKADKSGDTVVLTAGTVSAPSLTTVGDTNTGIYFPAADKVAIATGGTQRVIVDDSGNVGVGIASPLLRLDASSDNPTRGIVQRIRNGASSSQTGSQTLFTQNGIADWVIGQSAGENSFVFWSARNTSNDGNQRLRLDSSGNLGIGTTSPTTKLHVQRIGTFYSNSTGTFNFINVGRTSSEARIGVAAATNDFLTGTAAGDTTFYSVGTGNAWYGVAGGSGNIIFTTNNTERARINSSGNLGIGTTNTTGGGKVRIVGGTQPLVFDSTGTTSQLVGPEWRASDNSLRAFIKDTTESPSGGEFRIATNLNDSFITFATNNNLERARIDSSGNLGLGVTPSTWGFNFKALQVNGTYIAANGPQNLIVGTNTDGGVDAGGSGGTYKVTGPATKYQLDASFGDHRWYTAPSGTAGNAISFTQAMTLDASGNLGIGTTFAGADGKCVAVYNGSGAARLVLRNNTTGDSAGDGFQLAVAGADAFIEQRENANLIITTNNTERARITSDGNFLVGTTATTGSQTNTTKTVVGKITSNNGSLEVADNTATTMLSVTAAGASTFLVTVTVVIADTGSNYTVLGLLRCGGNTDSYTNIITAAFLTVSLSGTNLQVTQTSGAVTTVEWSLLRLL